MEYALANIGPLSISLGASAVDFYYYESGVYDGTDWGGNDPDDLGHTVLATGYGTSAWGQKYWWLRNSWSRIGARRATSGSRRRTTRAASLSRAFSPCSPRRRHPAREFL